MTDEDQAPDRPAGDHSTTGDQASDLDVFEWDDDADDLDDTHDDDDDVRDLGDDDSSVSVVAQLPSGAGTVVLTGHAAGSTVATGQAREDVSRDETLETVRLRSRDDALGGTAPIMIVKRPHRGAGEIPRLLATIVRASRGSVSLGASVPLMSNSAASATDWLSRCGAAAVILADPGCYTLDDPVVRTAGVSDRTRSRWPHLTSTPPDVGHILDAQRAVRANLLLTSGRALDPGDAQAALDRAWAEGDDALALLAAGERLALNLTLPAAWLMNDRLRDLLLAQLVDQEQFDVWHIRVQIPSSPPAPEQPRNEALLRGYKRLAQLAADEDRVLLLPQTGLTGWLQLAFGAAGFGTSLGWSDQAFREPSFGRGTERERYFEPSLLHVVDRSVHDAMRRDASYQRCDCPYCPALHASAAWDHQLARLHHVHWQGRLSHETTAASRTGPGAIIRRRVADAITAAAAAPVTDANEPRHLQVWDQLL